MSFLKFLHIEVWSAGTLAHGAAIIYLRSRIQMFIIYAITCNHCIPPAQIVVREVTRSPWLGVWPAKLQETVMELLSLVPSPRSPLREGSGDTGAVSWFYGHVLTIMLCNQSRAHCKLLCNGMQNPRAVFWLASAKPRQLTLYNIAARPDTISHENRRAAIWLAYLKTGMLSLQEPRKRSTVTRPFSSFEGGVWRKD